MIQAQRSKLLMVTAAVATVLPMTACGGGSQPEAKLTNTTASTASSATAATTASQPSTSPTVASTSAPTPIGLPDLTLPADVILQFNLPKTTDPTQDAALQGLVLVEKAKYKATEIGTDSGPLVDDFDINDANQQVSHYLAHKQGNNTTVIGTNVYYDWKFTQEDPNHKAAQITFCEDQNKFFAKDRTTGRQVPQDSGLAQILSFKVTMVVDIHDGRWKAGYYTWSSGDKACQAAEGH